MAILLNDSFKINVGNPIDSKYLNSSNQPYLSISDVNTTIPQSLRYVGLTVNINNIEYWYAFGVLDVNLIIKSASATGFTTITTFNTYTGATRIELNNIESDVNNISGTTINKLDTSIFNSYTGTTLPANYYNKNQINYYTGSTNLQRVTTLGAITNIESTFSSGIITNKIRPTGDTTTALQITNANGITPIINIDSLSGFTGFGTIQPKGLVHAFGKNSVSNLLGTESNALIIDGLSTVDKDIQWAENGEAKWLAETYRNENAKFWYLYNIDDDNSPLTVSETGRVGINNPSNIMNYHAAIIVGSPNDINIGGIYDQNYTSLFEIEIDGIGNPNTFRWRKSIDAGITYTTWSLSSGCTTGATEIINGITIQFDNITGHTLGTTFIFAAFPQLPIGTFVVSTVGFTEVQQTLDYTATPIIYDDVTAIANSNSLSSSIRIFNSGTTLNSIYFGTQVKIDSIFVNLNIVGSNMIVIAEYWNGSIWTTIDSINDHYVDGTNNLTQSGALMWDSTLMLDWIPAYMSDLIEDGYQLYWIRLRTTTNPVEIPIANSFARGGNYKLAILSAPSNVTPSMYVDSMGRTNIGGGSITKKNVLQVNSASFLDVAVGSQSAVEFDSANSDASDMRIKLASNDACGTGIAIVKIRGNLYCACGIETGDEVGHILFRARVANTGTTINSITSEYTGSGLLSSYCGDILFNTATNSYPTEKVRITSVGNTGFGISQPTAIIHLKAGTTSVAPLKFISGSLITSPQVGAIEFSGDSWYGTPTGGTRKTFAFLESPIFTCNPNLPIGTVLNNVNLYNYISNSGGTNNACKLNTGIFNTYTGNTQSILNTAITGSTNGLTKSGRNIGLGGTLCQNTIITGNTYNFTIGSKLLNLNAIDGINICDSSTSGIAINTNGGNVTLRGNNSGGVEKTRLLISDTQATFTDSRAIPTGIQYNNDYSANFTINSLVNKGYVDSVATGISVKAAVSVATTGNININIAPASIDGITLSIGNRILVKNQLSGATNGIYNYNGAGTGMTRSSDFNGTSGGTIVNGSYVAVLSGNTNKNTSWILNTPNPISVDVTPLNFVLFSTGQGTIAGNGITVTTSAGNYVVAVKIPTNSGLCVDSSGTYINSSIAGTGLCYSSGVMCVNGSGLAGNSLSWTGNSFNVNINSGTLSSALSSKLNVSNFNYYSANTLSVINNKLDTSIYSNYTGVTVPNTYESKSNFNYYSGTTVPNNYYNKTQINSYTGATNTKINLKAPIDSPVFTTFAKSVTPLQNDNSTCIATTAWYIGQAATTNPIMNGTVCIGTSNLFARQDHIHPKDTGTTRLSTYNTTATASGSITLTSNSSYLQYFTGTLNQTVVLPVVSTLSLGFQFKIVNKSTGVIIVNSSGSNTLINVASLTTVIITCILTTGTGISSWNVEESTQTNIPSGEKVVTVTSDGTQAYTDIVNPVISSGALDILPESAWSTGIATSPGIQGQSSYGTTYVYQCVGLNAWIRTSILDTRLNLYLTPDFDDSVVQGTTVLLDAAYPTAVIGQKVWGTTKNVYEKKNTNLWKKMSINFTNMDFLPQYVIQTGVISGATINILATFDISSIVVEALTTTAGNIYIGSTIGDNDIVNITSLPTTIGTKKQLNYLVNPNYPQSSPRNIYVGISSAASVNLHMVQQKLFI